MSTIDEEQALSQEREVTRGRRAGVLMRDPLIVEAFEVIDRAFYQAFRDIDPTDHQGIVHLRLLTKCLDEFKGFFTEVVATGKLTQESINMALQEDSFLEKLEQQRLNR